MNKEKNFKKSASYNPKTVEEKWNKIWQKEKVYQPDLFTAKKPFYNLMMFPYPSAEGLHIGNMYAFTGADIYGRFQRMKGNDVFEPIGLDGFGIHSENYALKVGRTPQDHAALSEKNFYRQLYAIGNGFDWSRKMETYDPSYYKWTQWLFIQLFKAGLAYRKKAKVNYCPKDKTVLADEQVIDGKCERCGTVVEKKELEQWFFKITKYADRLLTNIDNLNWSDKVKVAQKNWIGKKEGALIKFSIFNFQFSINTFTTRPDTLYGVTFLVLAPEHEIITKILQGEITVDDQIVQTIKQYVESIKNRSEIDRLAEGKEKTGVFSGLYAEHPLTKEKLPIWIADYVLMGYGTGAIMAVPAHDERDSEFAKKYHLPIKEVVIHEEDNKLYTGYGIIKNSVQWDGLQMPQDREKILSSIQENGIGKREVTYHLRDWLISRQRYWGPPIPMVYCKKCEWQPVHEKDLPVLLPQLDDWKPTGEGKGPLAKLPDWVNTVCPQCGGPAKRETDVSDSFLDSSWYFFRYTSIEFDDKPFDEALVKKWLPVTMYIGGAEHSVLHLLYARFVTMVFHDRGLIPFEEPFKRFYAHGLVIKDGAKMSKSKGNVIVPDEYISKYGSDVLRAYLMFLGPFDQGGDFKDSGIEGMNRFLKRVYTLFKKYQMSNVKYPISNKDKERLYNLHMTVKKVTEAVEHLRYNIGIANLMEYYNFLSVQPSLSSDEIETYLKLLAPFTPFMTEELWQKVHSEKVKVKSLKFKSIHQQAWPEYDPQYIVEDEVTVAVQINGKLRETIQITTQELQMDDIIAKKARESEKVKKYLEGALVKKTIYISGKIINFVID